MNTSLTSGRPDAPTRSPAESFLDNITDFPLNGDDRVILYLDVDGVLNPFKAKPTRRPEGYTTHRLVPTGWNPRKPLRVWLNPEHGKILNALSALYFDIVWATTWKREADLIADILGLPAGLPYVEIGEHPANVNGRIRADDGELLFYKTAPILEHAAGRRFAWCDDLSTDTDRAWVAGRHDRKSLLLTVDPAVGITDADFAALAEFAVNP